VSMESDDREPGKSVSDAEGVMFPTNPIWDRSARRRGFSGRKSEPVAEEPRSFMADEDDDAEMVLDRPVGAARAAQAEDDAGMVAPIGRSAQEPRSRGMGAGIAVAAVAAVAVLAAGGWYLMRDTDSVPELAAGAPSTEVATAAPAPAALPPVVDTPPTVDVQQAAATPPAEPPRTTVRTERRMASVARARPASSTSVEASGVDASATLPDGPQPYSSLNPGATPTPVNPTPAPTTQATPPTPTPAEPIPSTPPTAPEASPPSSTPDPTPQSATPPQ